MGLGNTPYLGGVCKPKVETPHACVCVQEKQGRKIKSQKEGRGGERNQINARIYAPAVIENLAKLCVERV